MPRLRRTGAELRETSDQQDSTIKSQSSCNAGECELLPKGEKDIATTTGGRLELAGMRRASHELQESVIAKGLAAKQTYTWQGMGWASGTRSGKQLVTREKV